MILILYDTQICRNVNIRDVSGLEFSEVTTSSFNWPLSAEL